MGLFKKVGKAEKQKGGVFKTTAQKVRSVKTLGDARVANQNRRFEKKEKKKETRRKEGWFARWQAARTERVKTRQENKNIRSANGGGFSDALQGIAGVAATLIRPSGETVRVESTGDGFRNISTGASYDMNEKDKVIINEETQKAMAEKGVKVENVKYTDENLDFIDDKTGKYIWAKESHENVFEYVWRLITHKNSPVTARVVGAVGTVVIVVVAVKYALTPAFKRLKKKLKF